MKALFVSNDPGIFVEGSNVRERMRAYAAAIGELHIVSRAPKELELQEGGLYLHGIRTNKLLAGRMLARKTRNLIAAFGIEIVSAQDPFEHGLAALRAVTGTNAKLHIQVHTDFLSPWFVSARGVRSLRMRLLNRMRVGIADRVLVKADGIRCVSERIKQALTQKYGTRIPTPSVVPLTVPSAVPTQVPLPEHGFTFVLVAVSRLESEKRIPDIFSALSLIKGQYPRVGLVVIGDGRERVRLKREAARHGLSENVMFLGDRSDAWGLMRSSNAFIQASAYEGYGRTLIEAALARVPIITTDTGIVGEVFAPGSDVLVAQPGDFAQLASHIRSLITDMHLRTTLPMSAEAAARAHLAAQDDLANRVRDYLAHALAPSPR